MGADSRFALLVCAVCALAACNEARRDAKPSALPDASNQTSPPSTALAEPTPTSGDAICQRFAATPLPPADMPSDADRASLASCDADALYYGIDMKVDYPRARQCAYGGKQAEGSPGADRPEILMMIYANGLGVPPSYDLAIRFACQAGGAPMERDGRVFRLWAVRAGERPAAPLDQCDDATSGLFTGYCSALQERQAAVARKARWQTVTAALPGPQLVAPPS